MSAESSDCEQINDWTLVNANGDECQGATFASRESIPEAGSEDGAPSKRNGRASELEPFQLESKICELLAKKSAAEEGEVGVFSGRTWKEGSEGSDIERISDDGLDVINCSMEASVISQISNFSLLNIPGSRDGDTESISGSSGISVIQEDDIRPTNYTHTPNRKLNFTLNLLLVLSVTMVIGLGVGHFIGWSSRWMHARQIHQAHIAKIVALQEELVDCLQNPASYYQEQNGESKACYEKVDYWKQKFQDMLGENRVLQEFVDRTMHKPELDKDEDDKCEEAHKNIVAEYRQLKFHLINQQLENVATLRQVEILKHQEKATLHRVKQLEEENEELKAQVEEELSADAAKEAEEKATIAHLTAENQELKQELEKLMATLKLEQEEVEKKTTEDLWPLQQQINQLKVENSELTQVIAKLRYGQPPVNQHTEKQEKPADQPVEKQDKSVVQPVDKQEKPMDQHVKEKQAPPRSRFANRGPPKEPDNALHSWLVDNMKELNLTDFIEYLTKVAMDKEAARRELMNLEENLKLSYEQLSEKAKHGIDTGKTLLLDLQKNLHAKLQQIMNVDPSDMALPIEHIQKAGKTLKKTVEKLYGIGMDMLNTKQEVGPENGGNHKFQKQVDKLIAKFGNQWENIKSSVWGAKLEEMSVNAQENAEEEEKLNDDIFVAASREEHEKDKVVAHEQRPEKSKKENDEKHELQKKTKVNNSVEKRSQNEEKAEESSNKSEKKGKNKKSNEVEKFRKNEDELSEIGKADQLSKNGQNDKSKNGEDDKKSKNSKENKKSKNGKEDKSKNGKDDKKSKNGKVDKKSKNGKGDKKSKKEKDERKGKAVNSDESTNSKKELKNNKSKSNKGEKEKFRKHHNKNVHDDEEVKSKDENKKSKKHKNQENREFISKKGSSKTEKTSNNSVEILTETQIKTLLKDNNPKLDISKINVKNITAQSAIITSADESIYSGDVTVTYTVKNAPKNGKRSKENMQKEKREKNHKSWRSGKSSSKKQNANLTKFNDDSSGDWVFQRADERTANRKSQHQSDWLFERAFDRENIRREAQKSQWYFKKNEKEEVEEKSNKSKNDKKNKKRRERKHWEDEDSSDDEGEFRWNEWHSRKHAYQYQYNVDWAMPNAKAYYAS